MELRNITLSEEIKQACPVLHVAAVGCEVTNSPYNDELWEEIDAFTMHFTSSYTM
jgi:hypothetical protein